MNAPATAAVGSAGSGRAGRAGRVSRSAGPAGSVHQPSSGRVAGSAAAGDPAGRAAGRTGAHCLGHGEDDRVPRPFPAQVRPRRRQELGHIAGGLPCHAGHGPMAATADASSLFADCQQSPPGGLLTICGDIRSVRDMPAAPPGGPKVGEAARAHAFAAIRQAILSGDLAPGRRLVEEDLAGSLGVTRQSLRAALLDLTADGLVERVPNRGARVRIVTTEEAVAITECRMALEALCAVKAALRITDEEAAKLRELGENLKRAVADGNPLRYSELNRELHRRVGRDLRAARRDRPARPAARPARPAPVPARAPPRPPRGLAGRAPGHPRRRRRPAAARRQPRRPRSPGQRHRGAAGSTETDQRSLRTMLNVIVTDPPRADLAEVDKLAELRRRHRARGDRPQRLPRARRSGRTSRAPASPAPR